jgi:hypothetical protein
MDRKNTRKGEPRLFFMVRNLAFLSGCDSMIFSNEISDIEQGDNVRQGMPLEVVNGEKY